MTVGSVLGVGGSGAVFKLDLCLKGQTIRCVAKIVRELSMIEREINAYKLIATKTLLLFMGFLQFISKCHNSKQ